MLIRENSAQNHLGTCTLYRALEIGSDFTLLGFPAGIYLARDGKMEFNVHFGNLRKSDATGDPVFGEGSFRAGRLQCYNNIKQGVQPIHTTKIQHPNFAANECSFAMRARVDQNNVWC